MSLASMLRSSTDRYIEAGIASAVSLRSPTISFRGQALTIVDDIWLYVYIYEKEYIWRLTAFTQVLEPPMAPLNRALELQE